MSIGAAGTPSEAAPAAALGRRLRVAFVINLAPRKLGSFEAWVVGIADEAMRRGHHIDVFGALPLHPVFAEQLRATGAGWHNIDVLDHNALVASRRLRRYDIVHLNLVAPRGMIALAAYIAWPTRVLFVDHVSSTPGEEFVRTNLLRRWLDHVTPMRMSGLVAVSDCVLRRDLARFHLRPPFARRIYNGINLERFTPPAGGRGARGGPPTVLAVANLIPQKGIHHLIAAFAQVAIPDARLLVVGDGPELEPLRELARSTAAASRITFLGLRNDVPQLLQSAHVFVHPCVWEEAFSLALAEALATVCPIVASRIGAVPEIVFDGETGLLVPPGDVGGLAAAMERLLADPAYREALGANARRIAEERFRMEDSARAHVSWCEEVAWANR